MLLSISGIRKYLVHGALIEAGILTPLPHAFAQLNPLLVLTLCPRCVNTSQVSGNVTIYFRNVQKICGAWGSNRSWDIDLPTPPCISSTWPGLWTLALSSWVCQHLPSGLQMYLCISGTYKLNVVHGALMEAEILTSLPPNVFVQLGLVFGHWHSAHRCVNTSQVV